MRRRGASVRREGPAKTARRDGLEHELLLTRGRAMWTCSWSEDECTGGPLVGQYDWGIATCRCTVGTGRGNESVKKERGVPINVGSYGR